MPNSATPSERSYKITQVLIDAWMLYTIEPCKFRTHQTKAHQIST